VSHADQKRIVDAVRASSYPLAFQLARWLPLIVILGGSYGVVAFKGPWVGFGGVLAVAAGAYAAVQTWHKRLFVERAAELGYDAATAAAAFDHQGDLAP
jgi:hypothetical protein